MAIENKNIRAAQSNVYTALLAFACAAVLATSAFVAYVCYSQYETIFKVAGN